MTRFAVRTSTTFVSFASQANWSPLDLAVCHLQVEGSEWTVACAIVKVHCGLRQVQHLGDGRLAAVFGTLQDKTERHQGLGGRGLAAAFSLFGRHRVTTTHSPRDTEHNDLQTWDGHTTKRTS